MLVADGDVPSPVVQALQVLGYGIVYYYELELPLRPDKPLMAGVLNYGGVLITRDTGIPSQAYLFEYAKHGLTVVLLRWKQGDESAWQEMALAILRDGHAWEATAASVPSVISVNRYGSRVRPWSTVPESIVNQAWSQLRKAA